MSTQNQSKNYTNEGMTQIACTSTKGVIVDNPLPEGDKQPVTPIVTTNSVVLNRNNTVSLDLQVDVDAENTTIPSLWIDPATKEFYV